MAYVLVSTENLSHGEWLEYRRVGIGGSDASVVCGINRWKSPIELYMEKLKLSPPNEAGEAAYWGTRLEDLVKEEFTTRTGIEVFPVNAILQHEEHHFMLANVDGICQHPIYGDVVFEAKTSGSYRSGEWEGDKIPDEYALQLQHYLAVTGFSGAFIAVLIGGNDFKWKFVERDDELISMLIQLEAEFWDRVQSEIPPELDGSDASVKFLNQHFPDSIPTNVELPQEARSLILQYDSACEQISEFTALKQEAENLLKQMLGQHEGGRIGDRYVAWKTVQQERLDSKAIKSDHPTLCKRYSNTISHRRFSVKAAS